ncbi:MAG: GNAT family N-acetyltransferase [Simkaniaceae bacterium]|nr:GNAT family N-acetyltransferase [Simkaniaceae bacterium]
MSYSVEQVNLATQNEMLRFLKKHENYSMYLRGNFEECGLHLNSKPNSGNFKAVRNQEGICAVFTLTKRGTLLVFSEMQDEDLFRSIITVCQKEQIPLKGVIGEWTFCHQFWEFLKKEQAIADERLASKEILYGLDLTQSPFVDGGGVRNLFLEDFDLWKILKNNDLIEQNIPLDLSDDQLKDEFQGKSHKGMVWGVFQDKQLISIGELNAKTHDLSVVGGVYTEPSFRRKGFAKLLMKRIITDVKLNQQGKKMILFARETNEPAQKLYQSLGFEQIGYFSLFFA